MTISKLSATLQNRIVANIKKNVAELLESGNQVVKLDDAKFQLVTTNNVVRLLSDKKQIGVVSAEAFFELNQSFKGIAVGSTMSSSRIMAKEGKTGFYRRSKNLKSYPDLAKYLDEQFRDEDTNAKRIADKTARRSGISKASASEIANVKTRYISAKLMNITKKLAQESQEVFSNPQELFNDFTEYLASKGLSIEKETKAVEGRSIAQVKNLKHRELNKYFIIYLKEKRKTKPYVADFIDANVDAGHLLGIFTQKLSRFFGATVSSGSAIPDELIGDPNTPGTFAFSLISASESDGISQQDADILNTKFSQAFNLLENIDFLSSSITLYPDIFAKLSKTVYGSDSPTAAAEFQFALGNQDIGRKLTQAGTKLNQLVKQIYESGKDAEALEFGKKVEDILKEIGQLGKAASDLAKKLPVLENETLKKTVDIILANSEQFGIDLLNSEGSDSLLKAIGVTIASKIGNKKLPPKQVSRTGVNKSIAPKPKKVSQVSSNKKNVIKKGTSSTNKSTVKLQKAVAQAITSVKVNTGTANLTSLQNLINASLVEQVKRNMGRGERRDVLNLRTGRFAESVRVERMSQSREGMITAFYSYMKNPYATFSQGGAQDTPKSRDPKLLIAKSIREIAAQQVANRLRSISV
jgi:hypothetical protein